MTEAETQQWHSAFNNQPPVKWFLLFLMSSIHWRLVYTKKNENMHFSIFVRIMVEKVMTALRKKLKKNMLCLLIFSQIIHSLSGSAFVEMASWGPKHDSHPKWWLHATHSLPPCARMVVLLWQAKLTPDPSQLCLLFVILSLYTFICPRPG